MQICAFEDCVGKYSNPLKCSKEGKHVSYISGLNDTLNWDL